MTKPIFYEGQQVGCLMFGEGIVGSISNEKVYVKIKLGEPTYYLDGKYFEDSRPTLYPIEQYRAIIANLPAPQPEAWKPKPGEWCWFWNRDIREYAVIAQFGIMQDDNKYPYFLLDRTSAFMHCAPFTGELPDHLKEVQP